MYVQICFVMSKKTWFEISGLCGSHPLPWYQMVSDTFRVPCGWFPGLRSVRKTFRADLPVKNMIFRPKSTDSPIMVQGLAEVESGREINDSRPSEGAQRATGDQIQQKPSRNFISGPVSPPRGILGASGGIEVETDLNSLLYTSFTSPLRFRRA